jgi:eukaryotic-like serine/threonine-protein kinase
VAVVNATEKLLRFGVFELNLDSEELHKAGTIVKLAPQPFKLLVLLASHAGQVVTRDEIQKQLWGEETFVDFDQGVNKCIKQIRAALNDNPDKPLYVETLPRHGYRFLAPVVSKTVLAPQSRVKESSSGIGSGVLAQVHAGIAASSAAPPVDSSQPMSTNNVAAPALETAPISESAAPGGGPRIRWVAITLIALCAGGLYYWYSYSHHSHQEKAPPITEKDVIVLADFDNTTGDSVFDDTLKTALTVALNQSPFLNVLPDSQVTKTLKLMTRPEGTKLTSAVAREVCQRTGSKAMVTGSIAGLGSQYVIGLEAMDCASGDVLAQVQEQANGKEKVLQALQSATVKLRSQVGESLGSVQKYATPVEEATTTSLEALQAYSLGIKIGAVKGETAALPFFQRAVEIDPNFAMAYRALAVTYGNLAEPGRATKNARKAYELREKVSDRERYSIEAFYYNYATGELEKAAQVYEVWRTVYPRDAAPYGNLGGVYSDLGNRQKALEEDREALRLEPNEKTTYLNVGGDLAGLNRFDEAESIYREAEDRKLEGESLLADRYGLAFVRGDIAEMARLVSASASMPGMEDQLLMMQANTEAWYGKLNSARELTRRAIDAAVHNDATETAALYQALAALTEAETGNLNRARTEANAAVKLMPNRSVQALAAIALARAGDAARAEKLAADLDREYPLGTLVQRYWVPTIRAAIALRRSDPNHAIKLLKLTAPIELGAQGNLQPVYLRAENYLMLRDGDAAAREFQKFIDNRGLVMNFPWAALARLGLARAYALDATTDLASRDKARAAYQNFLVLWKDADPDVPVLQQAKEEYARLQ